MNVFYVDSSPVIAAQSLVDRHVVKMILESCQLLSTAHRIVDGKMYIALSQGGRKVKRWKLDDQRDDVIYQATHVNHPSSVWCRECQDNYYWLFNHTVELTREYTYRYGKRHKCCDLLGVLGSPPQNIPTTPFTQPTPAMDKQYIISEDSVENYRNYYIHGKKHLHKYTKRPSPSWLVL